MLKANPKGEEMPAEFWGVLLTVVLVVFSVVVLESDIGSGLTKALIIAMAGPVVVVVLLYVEWRNGTL